MAVYLYTAQPRELLSNFKKKIDEGRATTWSYDQDGDFTHTTDQWKYKAWLRPSIESDRLILYILRNRKVVLTHSLYGIYHGRFIESALTHCDKLFASGVATAMPGPGDQV